MMHTENETASEVLRCAAALFTLITVQHQKLRLWLVFASSLALALTARSAYAASAADPCTLLTQAQVSAAAGVEVGTGKQSGKADCQWSQPGGALRGRSVLLEILGPMGSATPADRFNTVKTPLPVRGITKEPASGIGDDAVYVQTGGGRTALYVKKGDLVFRIQIFGIAAAETKAKEKTLAQEVLAKL